MYSLVHWLKRAFIGSIITFYHTRYIEVNISQCVQGVVHQYSTMLDIHVLGNRCSNCILVMSDSKFESILFVLNRKLDTVLCTSWSDFKTETLRKLGTIFRLGVLKFLNECSSTRTCLYRSCAWYGNSHMGPIWESHGNGKHRLNLWEWEREWEWWTENGREMGIVVWKKFPLVAL